MPTPEQVKQTVAGVFDRASQTYDQTGTDFFTPLGTLVANAATLRAGDRVLDVGSGRGAVLLPAAAAVGPTGWVDGVDLAPGMVSRLTADLGRLGIGNASVVLGDAERPPVEGPYDVVVSGLVLFFLPDPAAALQCYATLLRPGGRLAFSSFSQDDSRWGPAVFARMAALIPTDGPPARPGGNQDGPFSSDERLSGLVSAAGFVDVAHVHHDHVTSFASKDAWWRWAWSHGARAALERIPAESLDDARSAAYQGIDEILDTDGSISLRQSIRVTTALTPG